MTMTRLEVSEVGFQEYRVHPRLRNHTGGYGLEILGTPDFEAIRGARRLITHVLGFKRCHREALVTQIRHKAVVRKDFPASLVHPINMTVRRFIMVTSIPESDNPDKSNYPSPPEE